MSMQMTGCFSGNTHLYTEKQQRDQSMPNQHCPIVLIVDDDTFIRKSFRVFLEESGYRVLDAKNGRAALELLKLEVPDLILLDLRMPELDGFGVLKKVRKQYPTIPVVVVSGTGIIQDVVEALQMGAWNYLVKPIEDMTVLSRAVENALERARSIRENREYQERLENEVAKRTSELERAKQSLSESERKLESIIRQIPDIVYRLDPEGCITFINQAITRYGYSAQELIGRNVFELIHPGDREPVKYCVNERRTGKRRTKSLEMRLITRQQNSRESESGKEESSVFCIEAEGLYSINDRNERVFLGTQGIARDITAQKKAEQALCDSEAKYRELVQNANSLIVRMDTKGTITFFNEFAQTLLGFQEREVIGKNFAGTIVSALDSNGRDQESIIWGVCQNPQHFKTIECESIKKDGELVWIIWTTKPIYSESGDLKELLCAGMDITEQKALKEQFLQLQKVETMGMLAGGVAHDFNNLLTVIMGCSAMVLDDLPEDHPLQPAVKEIHSAGERANLLTRQLLAYSRRQILQPETLNLNELILNMDKMLRRLIGENIELRTNTDTSAGFVKADPGQIEQIVMNLAINARDAMPNGGNLTIEIQNAEIDSQYEQTHPDVQSGSYVMLTITDTGCGMNREIQQKIFDPFFTTKSKGKGTGLGLSTVYGIVKQSNGHIIVESRPGHGSSFKIYLPRVNEKIGSRTEDEKYGFHLYGVETALVVEDEDNVRHLVKTILEERGYTVLEAKNGEIAYEVSGNYEGEIHILITDVIMPKASGVEVAQRLSSSRPSMKVLYISGYTDHTIILNGSMNNKIHFLQKPFTPESMLRKVRVALETDR